MKFRSLVALTAFALFLLFFFLGLSSGSGMTNPSQHSLMYKLFNGTGLILDSSREAALTIVLQVQDALDLSIIKVNQTTQIVKETFNNSDQKKAPPLPMPPNDETSEIAETAETVETADKALEGGEDQEQLPAQKKTAENNLSVLLYDEQNLGNQPIFEEQMQYLAANQFVTITVPEIESKRTIDNNNKLIVLTFDLGFKEFYDKVFPVLQKHNLKATIYGPENYQPEAAEELVIEAFLRKGSSGTKTKELQQKLNNFGYQLLADGLFGPYTRAKVIDFQRSNYLLVDGIVGPQTTGQVNKLVKELQAIQKSELIVIMNQKPELTNEYYVPEDYPISDFSNMLQSNPAKE